MIRDGFSAFGRRPWPVIAPVLVSAVGLVIANIVIWTVFYGAVFASAGTDHDSIATGGVIAALALAFVSELLVLLASVGWVYAALELAHGRAVTLREAYASWPKGRTIVLLVTLGLGYLIPASLVSRVPHAGDALLVIYTLLFALFTQFAVMESLTRRCGPLAAVLGSVRLVTRHPGTVLPISVVLLAILVVGTLVCLVGLVVAIPLALVVQAAEYYSLHQSPASPASP